MKEAQIFENWINNLSEGTWALPETPEQMEKLNQLMSAELIVGPDATNATELLYDIVGDDELFDILNDLADRSEGRANIWDDSDVQRRLAELGVQTPQSTAAEPADVAQDTAPAVKEQGMAEGWDPDTTRLEQDVRDALENGDDYTAKQYAKMAPTPEAKKYLLNIIKQAMYIDDLGGETDWKGVAEGDNQATFVESNELARMLKHAGVPVSEGVLTDSTGSTLEHIKDTYKRDVKDFMQTGEMSRHLEQVLYDYYYDDMPYGAKTGEDLDTSEWISDRFAEDLGIDENLITPMIMPVSESSCNMTMEGEYCPEHGLAECGMASGGAMGMPFSLGEEGFGPAATAALQQGKSEIAVHSADVDDKNAADNSAIARSILIKEKKTDDPINSNSAMTGAYYEGKESKSQEGDALLARIKSLALLR